MSITPYTFDLEPGQTKHQTFGESNYIFVDFADRTVEVLINNGWQSLRKGSRYRSKTGLFDRFDIRNPDPDNPVRVIMFIGTDEIDNQIVEGEISIVPVLRSANGTTKTDTRYPLDIDLTPSNLAIQNYVQGDLIASGPVLENFPALPGEPVDNSFTRVFTGANGYAAVQADANSADEVAGGSFVVFDSQFNQVDSGFMEVAGVTDSDFGWSADFGYFRMDSSGVVTVWDGSKMVQVAATRAFADLIYGVAYIPDDGRYALTFDNYEGGGLALVIVSPDLQTVESVTYLTNVGTNERVRYDWTNKVLWVSSGTFIIGVSYPDLVVIEDRQSSSPAWSPDVKAREYAVFNERIFFMPTNVNGPAQLLKHAVLDFVTKPVFRAVRAGCDLVSSLIKEGAQPQITASVVVTESPASVKLSGEIIKAALEYYFRRAMPADYLEHVYAFDASADALGGPFKPVVSGNDTFKRAGVVDDFAILLPGRISLTLDNDLTLGDPLQ